MKSTPPLQSDGIEKYAKLYQDLVRIPEPKAAWLHEKGFRVQFGQQDLAAEKSRNIWCDYLKLGNNSFQRVGFPLEADYFVYSPSPSGKLLATIQVEKENNSETHKIEIWNSVGLIKTISTKGKHGNINKDTAFGGNGLCWSPDETKIAYTAEERRADTSSFWKNDNPNAILGDKYKLIENWGESYSNVSNPQLFVLNWQKETIQQVKVPSDYSPGQMVWRNCSEWLVFVGYPSEPRRLGLLYCFNRPSVLFSIRISTKESTPIENPSILPTSCRNPRSPQFSPDGSTLIYLCSDELLTHHTCFQLMKMNWMDKSSEIVVDTVSIPKSYGAFSGLYLAYLPSRCFVDEHHIVLSTQQYCVSRIFIIDLKNKHVRRVESDSDGIYSFDVLDVHGRNVLASKSCINSPYQLLHGTISEDFQNIEWVSVHDEQDAFFQDQQEILKQLSDVDISIHSLGNFPETYDYILCLPKNIENPQVILQAHGGPHSGTTTSFHSDFAFFCLLGYAVVSVNYRGSIGYGKHGVNSLPGKIGKQDINDCIDALNHALKSQKLDQQNIFFLGGSHGGFIGAHIVQKEPRILAASIRNPVTNISNMYGVTDIPDWCLVEGGTDLLSMWNVSPMKTKENIKTPILFQIGDSDLRVPPSQGLQLYYALKESGVQTSVLWYPGGNHPLSQCHFEADMVMQSVVWFKKFEKH